MQDKRPICCECHRRMRCVKNDFWFITGDFYQVWAADKYECDGCGAAVLTGFADAPIATQHEAGFLTALERMDKKPPFMVSDEC